MNENDANEVSAERDVVHMDEREGEFERAMCGKEWKPLVRFTSSERFVTCPACLEALKEGTQ